MKIGKGRVKIIIISLVVILIIGASFAYYLFNMPHRDIQRAEVDFELSASELVAEYLNNQNNANRKYLDSEGESKVLNISGKVAEISKDFNSNSVVLLKSNTDSAGVSCTFTEETNKHITLDLLGKQVTIKGVIRSGASYDADLGMYENVIVEKCDIN